MEKLNLPEYRFRVIRRNNQSYIFDPIRKKELVLTPEEWVRQNFVQYLIHEKQYPATLTRLEMSFKVNKWVRRSDIVVFNTEGKPVVLVECKAPSIKIDQKVFDQIARYNMVLKSEILIVTNGIQHYCCSIDYRAETYHYLDQIPGYFELPVL